MTYQAQVYNVMIASPSDVAPERGIVREVLHEWNSVHAQTKRLVLMPIGWETHSSPEMGAHPQTLLNDQILAKCDLLVGVFWTRVGTKTPEYESGSVEEVERHIATGKPTMLYFSNAPVRPDSVDNEQYQRLKDFRQSCQSRGLYDTFGGLPEFRDKFYRHLQLKINESPFFAVPALPTAGNTEIVQSKLAVATLSKEAAHILKEASKDEGGTIMYLQYIGGVSLQVNGKNLITDNSRRVVAIWEAALKELEMQDLIQDVGHKGEIFEITKKGYEVAEQLPA